MPIYLYTTSDGETVERVRRMGKAPKSVKLKDGRRAQRNIAAEHKGRRSLCGNWPMISVSTGVHPRQISEARAMDEKLGVSCEFTKRGMRKFNDRNHRMRWNKATGTHDRDGGYGDG